MSPIKINELCVDLINYYQEDVNDFNISKIMVYYHWVIDEFVIEYDGMFMGYCSSIIEQYP